jgi:DNA-binding winged helix-turn-helix (wHTH) protein/TolB-like protein/Flp pilus assembly protein TadD
VQVNAKKRFYEFGWFLIDVENRLLLHRGEVVPLQPRTFDLLLLLVEQHTRVLSKDEVMKKIWTETVVEEANLTQNIYLLRKIFSADPNGQKYIETLPKRGYRFVAQVKEICDEGTGQEPPVPAAAPGEDEVTTLSAHSESAGQSLSSDAVDDSFGLPEMASCKADSPGDQSDATRATAAATSLPISQVPRRRISRGWLLAIAVLALAAGLAIYSVFRHREPPQGSIKSLAVIPFATLNARDQDDLIGLGIADDLVTRLSKNRALIVRPTSAVLSYAGKENDPTMIGRGLSVDAVLVGSVRKLDDRIRVNAQLFRVEDGKPLWADTFDGRAADIFTLQDRISEQLSQAMTLKLNGDERKQLTKHYTDNFEAFQLYQKGTLALRQRTREGFDSAIDYFQQALGQDANYALAYVGLATAHNLQNLFGFVPARKAGPKAEKLAKKALEMDETIANAHSALAVVRAQYDWNFPEAEKELRRAIELGPNMMEIHQYYALCLAAVARYDESRQQLEIAHQLDPNSLPLAASFAWVDYLSGHYDATIERSQRLLEANPKFYLAYQYLGYAYLAKQMPEPALTAFEKARLLSSDAPATLALLGYAYGVAGRKQDALAVLNKLHDLNAPAHFQAWVYIGLDEPDQAFKWLETAYQERSSEMIYLNVAPIYEPLRADPRFTQLWQRVGFGD